MPTTINCKCFRHEGRCTHQAAPRKLFGLPACIVWQFDVWLPSDTRLTRPRCALQVERPIPPPPPIPARRPVHPAPPYVDPDTRRFDAFNNERGVPGECEIPPASIPGLSVTRLCEHGYDTTKVVCNKCISLSVSNWVNQPSKRSI